MTRGIQGTQHSSSCNLRMPIRRAHLWRHQPGSAGSMRSTSRHRAPVCSTTQGCSAAAVQKVKSGRGRGERASATATEAPPAQQQHKKPTSTAQTQRSSAPVKIPDNLRKQVAVLQASNPSAPDGQSTVYVLGISHVSKRSVDDIKQLLSAVRPEVVLIELCCDRVGFLLPRKSAVKSTALWYAPDVALEGIPEDGAWPGPEQLLKLLKSQPNASVTTHDIESDCRRLLGTGLFGSVRPLLKPPTTLCAPQFLQRSDGLMIPAVPAGSITYILKPRDALPKVADFTARIDSSLGGGGLPAEKVQEIGDSIVSATADGTSTVAACLQARPRLQELAQELTSSGEVEVTFRGVHTGVIEAVIKAAAPAHQRLGYVSGLEGSAPGGEGPGIERFRPFRGSVELSPRMTIANIADIMPMSSDSIDAILGPAAHAPANGSAGQADAAPEVQWREWSLEERRAAEAQDDKAQDEDDTDKAQSNSEENEKQRQPEWLDAATDKFGQWLTQSYAQLQEKAGDAVGVAPGEAWRASLQAAAEAGVSQVHLGDLPAGISGQRLARGVLFGTALRLGAALTLTAGLVAANAAHKLPEGPGWAAPAAATAAWLAAAWGLAGPFLEIFLLSRKTGEQVEDAVTVREPLQGGGQGMYRLRGEDAIISFPGAEESVIRDRDVYMARTLRAAATGASASPALIQDTTSDGGRIWRYLMPESAEDQEHALQKATAYLGGEGVYQPSKEVSRVVGIVGTAHVRGILEHWHAAESDAGMLEMLSKD